MTEVFPILYKKRADGSVQQWQIELWSGAYRTISGIQGGQLVTSEWTYCTGKNIGRTNETFPKEQASLEAAAKWKKKIEGAYHESVENIGKARFVQPMLAHEFKKYEKQLDYPVYSQPKLDGLRSVASINGLSSRTGKPLVATPHILKALQESIFEQYPTLILDGELYCDKYSNDFEKIVSAVRKSKVSQKDKELAEMIEYHVYDIPSLDVLPFSRRYDSLTCLEARLPSFIKLVRTSLVYTRKQLDDLYVQYIEQGYEGQIVRSFAGPYESKRSKHLLKRKEFITEEFPIIDFEEGIGNRAGMVGRVNLRLPDGRDFGANIRGSHAYLAELMANRAAYSGQSATVRYFSRTASGKPRFPVVIAIRDYE